MNKITRNIAALIAFGIGTTTIGFAQITQQKIGNNPTIINPSAVIEVESANKGFLAPRVALTSTTNFSPITGLAAADQHTANSLLVYNTATAGDVTPGYYYWEKPTVAAAGKWIRIATGTTATTNELSSAANTMTSNVNGLSDTAPIINTNALSLSGKDLTSTVNGVPSTALNLEPLVTAANGLTENGTAIELGGDLNRATTIATTISGTTYPLNITGLPSVTSTTAPVMIVDGGQLKMINPSNLIQEPWKVIGSAAPGTPATLNTENIYQMGNVAIGATTAPSFLVGATTVEPKLHIAGDVSTTGKYYTTNSVYADYVFEKYFNGSSNINPNYEFKSLNYVKEFIKANNHLPGVESINDLNKAENGYTFDMTKLTIQSLEKIEELYLHTIEQQDKIDTQQEEIQLLKKQVKETEERLQRLENILVD